MPKKDNTKEIILAVATRLFNRFGFYKTSMDEIAKIAHKAKGSLYYHFASKEDLFREIVSIETASIKEQLIPILNDPALNEYMRIQKYLITRMEVINKAFTYHQALKTAFVQHYDDVSSSFLSDIFKNFENWEHEQIASIIIAGKNKKEIPEDTDVNAFTDMLMFVLQSLDVPFFIKGQYKQYAPTFLFFIQYLTEKMNK
jgi:AcrR family transcriptional regulator